MNAYLNKMDVEEMINSVPYVKNNTHGRKGNYKFLDGVIAQVDFAEAAKVLEYDPSLAQRDAAKIIFKDLEGRANAYLAKKQIDPDQTRGTHKAIFVHSTSQGDFHGVLSFEEIRWTFDVNPHSLRTVTEGIEVALYPI